MHSRLDEEYEGSPVETLTAANMFQALLRERQTADPATRRASSSSLVVPVTRVPLSVESRSRGRGWIMRRALLGADVTGILLAGLITSLLMGGADAGAGHISGARELVLILIAIPMWVLGAYLAGLYGFDENRANHSTADDLVRVFLLVTAGAFVLTQAAALTSTADPDTAKTTLLWGLTIGLITIFRSATRRVARRTPAYRQRTLVLGAGRVGQLLARKLMLHPEYGLDVVGFADERPREKPTFLDSVPHLGGIHDVLGIVTDHRVERVIIAFSDDRHDDILALIRRLRDGGVQVDVVPRFFEVVGPRVDIHTVEGMSLVGLPPVRLSRTASMLKRALDIVLSGLALLAALPVLGVIALLVKRDSPGPVFFRQTRLGKDMGEFTLLKFRTMYVDTDDSEHRAYIKASMASSTEMQGGAFKLSRENDITPVGRWLRKTSLDELPQLINVLRGDMSLVGPRPCLPYETDDFATHHFERFLVPAGLTGLWQVSARAQSTFGEALDMDVLYAQSASLGLDLRLMLRTPFQLLRSKSTA
jgi:exopolysaccharide biosynthesis polyprenyl glycosylphosphotransferase